MPPANPRRGIDARRTVTPSRATRAEPRTPPATRRQSPDLSRKRGADGTQKKRRIRPLNRFLSGPTRSFINSACPAADHVSSQVARDPSDACWAPKGQGRPHSRRLLFSLGAIGRPILHSRPGPYSKTRGTVVLRPARVPPLSEVGFRPRAPRTVFSTGANSSD